MTNESKRGSSIGRQERGPEESTTGRTEHVPRDVEQSGKSKQAIDLPRARVRGY